MRLLTTNQFANIAGVPPRTIQRWAYGGSCPALIYGSTLNKAGRESFALCLRALSTYGPKLRLSNLTVGVTGFEPATFCTPFAVPGRQEFSVFPRNQRILALQNPFASLRIYRHVFSGIRGSQRASKR
jgi:hypothetical protein